MTTNQIHSGNRKVIVFGANGMLGHKVYQVFREQGFHAFAVMRQQLSKYAKFNLFDEKSTFDSIDVTDISKVEDVMAKVRPDIAINAVGIVKQVCNEPVPAIQLNSLFPHQLAHICTRHNARLFQVSTDCVFSGKKGNYSETDYADAEDLYGKTKLMGEVTYGNHLTIRTSIIGRELFTHHGLLEWFLSQTGEVKGYTNAIFSGLSTKELSNVLVQLAARPEIKGLLNIGTDKIDKNSLLHIFKREFKRDDISIRPFPDFKIDRSLDISKMRKLGIKTRNYEQMAREMAQEEY